MGRYCLWRHAAPADSIHTMSKASFRSNAAWIALGVGVALVIAALVYAFLEVDFSNFKQAQAWHVIVLLAAVMLNLLLTSTLWWAITLSFDARPPVGFKKMFSLLCASGLLNYLPLRPGLIGRTAYLKMKHKLPIKQSIRIILTMIGLSALVLGGAWAVIQLAPPDLQKPVAAISTLVGLIAIPLAARGILRRKLKHAWAWVPLRMADLAVTTLRMWVAFRVVGYDITISESIVVASGGMVVALSGITPNGLGLREWTIGGLSTAAMPVGLAAGVVDRAIETLIIAITGLLALRNVGDIATNEVEENAGSAVEGETDEKAT